MPVLPAYIVIAIAVLVLPVVLRFAAEDDNPGGGVEHHSGDPDPDQEDDPGVLANAA